MGLVVLGEDDFNFLKKYIYSLLGIYMIPAKRILVQNRLQNRLKELRMRSFNEYCEYISSTEGKDKETKHFINAITTNKTDFFRDPEQFDNLKDKILPEIIEQSKKNEIVIWSAACATGEEPYSIAMTVKELLTRDKHINKHIKIIASDISTNALGIAQQGIYSVSKADSISLAYQKKYLLRGQNDKMDLIKVTPEIRNMVEYFVLNLMEDHFDDVCEADIIFCRNVFIYFQNAEIIKVIDNMSKRLLTGGYIIFGSADTIMYSGSSLEKVTGCIYRKKYNK